MNYNKPKRYFEKSGVVDPKASYYVSMENVTNMDNHDIKTMVDLGRYFSIFAPRQSGKTTFFEGFCHKLEKDPAYVAIMLSFQRHKNLDKQRFTRMFFREQGAIVDVSVKSYFRHDGLLNMEVILSDFEEYITQIGVTAFYKSQKPYEKTGQFLLTAWLYQFVEGGKGELRYEVPSGLGRMDILLIYQGHKYIIETKINRSSLDKTVEKAIDQLCSKYLLTEQANEGYVVIFDLKTMVGEVTTPQKRLVEGKEILSFNIGIRR